MLDRIGRDHDVGDVDGTVERVASKIAAEAADVANGLESAWKKEQEMGKARKEFDWEKQFSLAFDKSKPRAYRNKCELDDNEMCAMCGEYCSVKISKGDF